MYFLPVQLLFFPDISGQFDEGSQLSAETEMGKTLMQAEHCFVPIRNIALRYSSTCRINW